MEPPICFTFPKDDYHRYWVTAFVQAIRACARSQLAGALWRNDTCLGPSSDWFLVYMFQSYTLLKSWVNAAGVLIFKDLFSPPACIASLSAFGTIHVYDLSSVTDFRRLFQKTNSWPLLLMSPLCKPILSDWIEYGFTMEMRLSLVRLKLVYRSAYHSKDMPAQLLFGKTDIS